MRAVETTGSREVYTNPWITVREDAIVRPDGTPGIFGVVDRVDFALVIALDHRDRVALVEQYRYPLRERCWEFPQGTAPDRVPMDLAELAVRELREETGLTAASWASLGPLATAPGLTSQRGHAFLATDLHHGAPEREATEADMRMAWVPRARFETMVRDGSVVDAQSLAAWALLLLRERS